MERAFAQGFDVRVVALPPGQDPADAPDGFEERLGRPRATSTTASASSSSAPATSRRLLRAREILEGGGLARAAGRAPPHRRPARPAARDAYGNRAGARRAGGGGPTQPAKLLDAGSGSNGMRSPPSSPIRRFATVSPGSPRTFRGRSPPAVAGAFVAGAPPDGDLVVLQAELDARGDGERITRRTGKELLLRLRERKLRRDLQAETDLARATELQPQLAKVRHALTELALSGASRSRREAR